ncbi:hypothetical protein BKA70DRAFT_1489426 [Coprinopsis sp. MPI-PUGE-AT-0042]|nr:hypothetical protein BKA70DRAFT_1489426 [Coprinopsis sp. MPI-PUGE-AT-0042]
MSVKTRWVILDDDSPALNYTGPWGRRTRFPQRTLGPCILQGRLMGLELLSSVWGEWEGEVLGTSPFVNCTVDGQNLKSDNRLASKDFNCSWTGEESNDGQPHTFHIQVGVPEGSNNSPISVSIDSVRFLPSPDFGPLNDPNAVVEYKHDDPLIEFVNGTWTSWPEEWPGTGVMANGSYSSARVLFNGTRITWVGRTLGGYGELRTTGQYSISGGPPHIFDFDPPAPGLSFDVARFETGSLSKGTHTFEVVYMGGPPPLLLDYLLVEGGNYVIEAEQPKTPSTLVASVLPTPSSHSRSGGGSTDAVVGSVVGVALFFGFSFLAWFLAERESARRQKKHKSTLPNSRDGTNPSAHPMVPSSAPDAMSQTPTSTQAPTDATRLPLSDVANDQRSQNDSTVPQGPQTADASVAGPSTIPPTSTVLHVQGAEAKHGNLSVAGNTSTIRHTITIILGEECLWESALRACIPPPAM